MNSYNSIAGFRLQRIEAVSDGVFAIALTFLALDIKVPSPGQIHTESELIRAFISLSPKLLTYFLSFITLGIYWLAQSTQFHYITASDRNLNWISLFFLLAVSIMPFTTAFLSGYIHFRFAVWLYWLNLSSLGLLLGINWHYAQKCHLLRMTDTENTIITKAIKSRVIESQILYTVAACFSLIHTYLSLGMLIMIQLNYALALFSIKKKFPVKE